MAHQQQIDFCKSVKQHLPDFFSSLFVLDIGSLDINGNNQYLFDDCLYLGIDLLPGKNVDLATTGHELRLPDESVDVIISTECFEHDQFYSLTLKNIVRMLKPGGLFVFSCASTGRPEHGTRRTSPENAPFTKEFGEWGDYYKNLEEGDIRRVLDIDALFEKYAFSIGMQTNDLYFWGVKKGAFITRHDYSFQIQQAKQRSDLKTREIFVVELLATISERDRQISGNNQAAVERDGQIANLNQSVTERNGQIANLNQSVTERDGQIDNLNQSVTERDGQIDNLNQAVTERDGQIDNLNQAVTERDGQIDNLNQSVTERDGQIDNLNQSVTERDGQIDNLNQSVTERDGQIARLLSSNSWRLTKPLRFLGRIQRGAVKTAFSPLMGKHLTNVLTVVRRGCNVMRYVIRGDLVGLNKAIRSRKQNLRVRKQQASIASTQQPTTHPLDQERWGIMSTQHTLFIAQLIADRLRVHGFVVDIITEAPDSFKHAWYIVICPQMFEKLPPGDKRIAYQLEQSVSSRWFTPNYLKILENSLAVLEYSLINIDFMASKGVAYPYVHYLPVGATTNCGKSIRAYKKNCEILFYGDSKSSPRRREMLDALSQHFNVRVVNEVYGHDMQKAIKQARLVINLHYYENALLEMPRIQECLSLGVPVVSESAQDQEDYPELVGVVRFFEQGSIPAMLSAVKAALEGHVSAETITESVALSTQRFAFMFDRFLVAMEFLPAAHVNHMRPPLPSSADRVVLSLPETIGRRRAFDTERPTGCAVFDGIRRRPGWVGCGLSYLILAQHALKQGMSSLSVMEDDVLLPADFDAKMAVVQEFLDARPGKWDVFAGIIASLHTDVKILSVEVVKGITFVTINKMTSMVFNIYNEKALGILASWEPENIDVESNTIDRFLESQADLRVVVTLPFLVGHREELHSTLWGFQNTEYNDMIKNSEQSLKSMTLAHNRALSVETVLDIS